MMKQQSLRLETTLNKYKAAEGKVLPVKINKQIVYITSNAETEIDLSKCDYQTCLHLQEAIKNKEIFDLDAKPKVNNKIKGE